jgi:NAD(P)-dependent dehydrogenase (short-subunit alcohol dehydrogenase family)
MVAGMLASEPEAMKEIMKDQPIGRLGRPEEIAAPVLMRRGPPFWFITRSSLIDNPLALRYL